MSSNLACSKGTWSTASSRGRLSLLISAVGTHRNFGVKPYSTCNKNAFVMSSCMFEFIERPFLNASNTALLSMPKTILFSYKPWGYFWSSNFNALCKATVSFTLICPLNCYLYAGKSATTLNNSNGSDGPLTSLPDVDEGSSVAPVIVNAKRDASSQVAPFMCTRTSNHLSNSSRDGLIFHISILASIIFLPVRLHLDGSNEVDELVKAPVRLASNFSNLSAGTSNLR